MRRLVGGAGMGCIVGIRDLNSFDFPPPYNKKIDLSGLFGLLSCRGNTPIRKSHFRYQWSA